MQHSNREGRNHMKKRVLAIFLAAFAAVGMTACGGKEVETQEVDYDMTFENQTVYSTSPNAAL